MKSHNGMRPHDIVVLLKVIALKEEKWMNKDLSAALFISQSEISESLNRSMIAGLLGENKRMVMKNAFLRFLENGLRFVFPAELGPIERGMPTGHSAPVLKPFFTSQEAYVWPFGGGKARGQSINPLYPNQARAAELDEDLYNMLALVDAIRIGKVRECEKAVALLNDYFKGVYA